jgi:cytochrome c-type biogenesis protein CcmE
MEPETQSAGVEEVPGVVSPEATEEVTPKRRGWLTVALLVGAAAAIAALVLTNFKDSTVYAKGVDQVVAEKGKWTGRNVRVEGTLVKGTLKFQEKPCLWEFDATRNNATVHVKYPSCIKPDTLRDDMPDVGVTVEGKLASSGEFQATNVLAKCPSKYDQRKGGAPHDKVGAAAVN